MEWWLWLALCLSWPLAGYLGYMAAKPEIARKVMDTRKFERAFAAGQTLEALNVCKDAAKAAAEAIKIKEVAP